MVITTPQPRQVSIREIPALALFLIILSGCQTPRETGREVVPAPTAAAKGTPAPGFLSPENKPLPQSAVPPSVTPTVVPIKPPAERTPGKSAAVIPAVKPQTLEIANGVPDWRITRLSAREWRAIPLRRGGRSDSPPSLMEDAIITSGIHSKLKTAPGLRESSLKYSSNAGSVALSSPELSCAQALAVLQTVATVDKVSEVRLITTLR